MILLHLGPGNVHYKILSTACSCYYPMDVQGLVQELGGMQEEGLLETMKINFDSFQHTSYIVGGYSLV